ncbi:50S ribosome-binding GTPase [Nonomuraea solani]|uniref:50S ribosome-binding GTPase n=1 Tax=Nonomuraea solani TaxID=1144553 RepID=A0A1H6ET65_9ACTN|nr:GTPase [Nonomuraea solani]SEH00145.1 50S ribosome-binding GTPase [Nonomuraea solani]
MITCPYCFAKVAPRHIGFRCMGRGGRNQGCQAQPDEVLGAFRGGTPPVLPPVFTVRRPGRRAVCPACARETAWRVCPACHSRLPTEYCANPGKIVALVGAKNAGKSTYIAVLVHELMNRVGEELGASLVPCDDRTIERYKTDFDRPLYGEHQLLAGTQSAGSAPRDPLVYRFTRTVPGRLRGRTASLTLVLFDTAGEDLRQREMSELHLRYLSAADAVIFLLDPLELPGAQAALSGSARGRGGTLADDLLSDQMDVIVRVTELLRERDKGRLAIPAAVALSKIDELRESMERQSALHRTREPVGALDLDDREAVDEQVRALLQQWQAGMIDRYLSQQYRDYALFGLSALGTVPEGRTVARSGIRPYRIEDPLLWLLYRFRMLDGIRR